MNTKRILGLGFLVALSACKGQCSCGTDSDDGDSGVGGTGGGSVTVSVGNGSTSTAGEGGAGTGGDATGTGGDGGAPPAVVHPQVRFVNVATNVDELNFCLKDDQGTYVGPLQTSLASPGVSDYTEVDVDNYQLVVIAADGECADEDVLFDPLALQDGGVYSLALVGDAEELDVAMYDDDLALPAAGNVKLRFVHAAEGAPNVDIGVYEGEQFIPFFQDASFPNDSGYTEVPAFTGADLVARAAGTETDLITITDVNGQDGDILNAYAIGNPTDGVDVFFFSDGPVD